MGRHRFWLIPFCAAISLGGYLLASSLYFRVGFPLDDAWIHQTYARNMALRGEWAFLPGQPSAGSTSPLWTALLTPGFWVGAGPLAWAFFGGWLILSSIGLYGMRIQRHLTVTGNSAALAAGLFLCLEWHLVWAAASGMETLLFALIVLIVFDLIFSPRKHWLLLGLIAGLSIWLRPDGLTLLGPVFFCAFFEQLDWKSRFRAFIEISGGIAACLLPYLLFNQSLSGALWPNTFFAKQAEYAIVLQTPFLSRAIRQFGLVLIGPGAILFPGFLFTLAWSVRERKWPVVAMELWLAGFLLIYAMRLPVTYQHGRYVIPAMPVYFLFGLAGMTGWVKPREPSMWRRVIGRTWALSLGIVLISFWFIGAQAYARDVAVIESEMVASAKWIEKNTEPDSLIAAHDIGALGYFGNRRLIDLAGLVSPQVIPFIRDEARLAKLLDEEGANYLMTFPGWYPGLVDSREPIFETGGIFSPLIGGENMRIYLWP
jgi:hypothetical protein